MDFDRVIVGMRHQPQVNIGIGVHVPETIFGKFEQDAIANHAPALVA